MLTQAVQSIAVDFGKAWRRFEGVDYDVLDVSTTRFDDDFFFSDARLLSLNNASSQSQSKHLIAHIMAQFKALESFGVLLHRPSVKAVCMTA